LARMTVQKMGKLSPFFHISLPYMGLAQTSSPPARAGSREKRFGKAKPFMVASALPALLFIQTTHTKWKRTMRVSWRDGINEGRPGWVKRPCRDFGSESIPAFPHADYPVNYMPLARPFIHSS
jgi:hypothetical protein